MTLKPIFKWLRIGHFGTCDLEITVKTLADLEKAKSFLIKSYEAS